MGGSRLIPWRLNLDGGRQDWELKKDLADGLRRRLRLRLTLRLRLRLCVVPASVWLSAVGCACTFFFLLPATAETLLTVTTVNYSAIIQ